MTSTTHPLASLAAAALLAAWPAGPALAEPDGKADVAGLNYTVLNHTGGSIDCRYRIGEGAWREARVAAGNTFTLFAGPSPADTLSFTCNPRTAGIAPSALDAGQRYRATRRDGRIVITRLVL